MDIEQFFPAIDHAVLSRQLRARVDDPRLIEVVTHVIRSGEGVLDREYSMRYFDGDDLLAALRPRGLPIGNLTSQLWANHHLCAFDHFVKRELRCPGYVRYVDDLLFFDTNKRALRDVESAVRRRLSSLRLTAHDGAHPKPVTEGIPFLGWVVYPGRRRLKRRKVVTFVRYGRSLVREVARGQRSADDARACVRGWLSHTRHGNTTGLRRAVVRVLSETYEAASMKGPDPCRILPDSPPR